MHSWLLLLTVLGPAQAGGAEPENISTPPRSLEPLRIAPRQLPSPQRPPPPPPPSRPFPVWVFVWVAMLPALVAAQRQQKRLREEEESKTPYTEEDLMNDWEFKILRDPLGRFGREAFRARILQEESAGGWQLVEVFDGARMRLKRPPSARAAGVTLPGYDPYRLALRAPAGYAMNIVLGILGAIAAGILVVCTIVTAVDQAVRPGIAPLLGIGAGLAAVLAIACFLFARRKTKA
jgi:hypothetical protein